MEFDVSPSKRVGLLDREKRAGETKGDVITISKNPSTARVSPFVVHRASHDVFSLFRKKT
jgi:hypothetical protein